MAQDVELVTILETTDATQLALAEGLLEDAGIPYLLNGSKWGPVSKIRAMPALTGDAPFQIQVARHQAAAAEERIAHLRNH
jgi:hypothetical protein